VSFMAGVTGIDEAAAERVLYCIERWELGWVVCSPMGLHGVPMTAMQEVMGLLGKSAKGAILDPGIVHHLIVSFKSPKAIMAICSPKASQAWRESIKRENKIYSLERQWWLGCDVGTSSASIFRVLTNDTHLKTGIAVKFPKPDVPRDSDDLTRCINLVNTMQWRDCLYRVEDAYPELPWGEIIIKWDDLVAMGSKAQTEELRAIYGRFENDRKMGGVSV